MDTFEFTRLVEALEVVASVRRETSNDAVRKHVEAAEHELRSAVRQGVEAMLEGI